MSIGNYLNFHGLGPPGRPFEKGEERVWLDTDVFRAMLDVLAETDEDVGISFDDGNKSDVDIALPMLCERGFTATFFVLAGQLGKRGYLSAPGVVELAAAGMTIGTHGMHHRDWRTLDETSLQMELEEAPRILEDILGTPVDEAACPFGSYDRRVLGRLRAVGYRRVYTSDGGPVGGSTWLIPRSTLYVGDDGDTVRRLVSAAQPSPSQLMKRAVKRFR